MLREEALSGAGTPEPSVVHLPLSRLFPAGTRGRAGLKIFKNSGSNPCASMSSAGAKPASSKFLGDEEAQSAFFIASRQIRLRQMNLGERLFTVVPEFAGAANAPERTNRERRIIGRGEQRQGLWAIQHQLSMRGALFLDFGKGVPPPSRSPSPVISMRG
ncbi:MAG TPA: hypothetical protein VME69_17060 [Methylocella sp.]|nr:hypothetical protein [Methylocella sp.]